MSASRAAWADSLARQLSDLDSLLTLMDDARSGRRSTLSADEEERLGLTYDGSDIPNLYERIITRVIDALRALPEFADGRGLAALQALRLDLHALDEGHLPERLKPIPRESRPGTKTGPRVFQAHVISCVRLLEELGLSGSDARGRVAAIFSQHGHRGRQGDSISPETLTKWREAILGEREGQHAAGRRLIECRLSEWKQDQGWPMPLDDALKFIERQARHPVISLAASK